VPAPDAPEEPGTALAALAAEAATCRRCRLCDGRRSVVFGEGSPSPRLMVVGEAPGADEDASGRPFVGKAGQLLTRMLASIGLRREEVYIANVLKCRPPGNRPPQPDEVAACRPYLRAQAEHLRPELVLVLGNHAARALLQTDRSIGSIRGRPTTSPDGLRVLPTFHPAYLLRTPEAKREAWMDLQTVARELSLTLPPRRPAGEVPAEEGEEA
jgi:DNA polymerase